MKNASRSWVVLSLALACLACVPAFAKRRLYPACGAIARDGRFAAALPSAQGLGLEVSRADGSIEKAQLELAGKPEKCQLAFNRDGGYAALGVRVGTRTKTWLHVGVFDCRGQRWVSSFRIEHEKGMPFPMRFEGFLRDTNTLVVTGFAQGTYQKPDRSSVSVALFSLEGELLRPVTLRKIQGSYFNWGSDFADATHNRVWFSHDPRFCPLSSVSLTGPMEHGPEVGGAVLGGFVCDLPDAFGFPSENILVGAVTRSDRTWVWRVDLTNGHGEKLELPQSWRGPLIRGNQYQTLGELPVSADGQVFAVPRAVVALDLLDHAHFGGGAVYVLQVSPLKLLGVVRSKRGCGPAAVALAHRGGKPVVLNHRCSGGWKLVTLRSAGAR